MFAEMVDAFIGEIVVDGQPVRAKDLTFGEQVKVRQFVRHLAPNNDEDEASSAEFIPAIVTVVKQRTDPDYTLEQALELKDEDVKVPPIEEPGDAEMATS